jgi:chromosome segregation ATPase
MADISRNAVVAHRDTPLSSEEKNTDLSAQITAQVTMALSALDGRYKENVAAYAQELHASTHEIETARIELVQLQKEREPYLKALEEADREIDHQLRMLEYLTEQWTQKAVVIAELENELEVLSYSPNEGDRMLQNRRRDIDKVRHEIEDLEIELLNRELEKQNLLLKIEPFDRKITAVEKRIGELESRKRFIESSYLHRITEVTMQQPQLASETVR